MTYLDYIILLIIVVGFLLGFKDGLVRKIIGLIGFIAGLVLAFEFSDELGLFLKPIFNDEIYFSNIISGFLIFVLAILVTSIIKRIIHPLDKVNKFINQLMGGFAGVLQIIIFISGFFLFLNIFNLPNKTSRNDSLLYQPIADILPNAIDFVIGENSETKNLFKEYIEGPDTLKNVDEIEL